MEPYLKLFFWLGFSAILVDAGDIESVYDEFDLDKCVLSKDLVANLSQSILDFNKERFSDVYSNLNEVEDSCEELFQQIKSGYEIIRDEFINISNIVDVNECVKSASKMKTEIDSLKIKNSELTEKVSDIETYREKLLDYFKLLLNLGKEAELTEILNLYYAGEVKNVKTIIFYFRNYFMVDYFMISAFERLYLVMEGHGHLSTDEALILKANLLDALTYSDISNTKWTWIIGDGGESWHGLARGVVNLLDESTKTVLEKWKNEILEENFLHIKNVCSDYSNTPKYLMKELVAIIYKNDRNVIKKILNFADFLNDDVLAIWVYGELYSNMMAGYYIDVPEIFILGSRIKALIAKVDLSHLHQSDTDKLALISASLPLPIHSFLWNFVCFENVKESQNLVVLEKVINSSRNVELSAKCKTWQFEILNDGQKFRIKNVEYGEYLYAGDDEHSKDAERRRVFTSTKRAFCDGEDEWILEPFHNCGQFYVKNVKYEEYLFSDPLRMNMVYTFRDKEHMVKNSLWTFSRFLRWRNPYFG